ncbi:MAG: glycerophosphodiester phosphodiesterase [Armatimonadetes bacterium]|nr:glycerophosphodiester phosphodiesterase [Armatimonadota bacterium]
MPLDRPCLVGHRGAAALAPENTLDSFRLAWERGVRTMELDVQLTRDRVVVCLHDDRLDRVTAELGRVDERDWVTLRELTVCPGAFHNGFPHARIPTLAAVLTELDPACRLVVELKRSRTGADLVRETLRVIREAGAGPRCRLISFEPDLLRLAREALPHPEDADSPGLGVLVGAADCAHLLPRAKEFGAVALHAHHWLVNSILCKQARAAGYLLNAWTVNDRSRAEALADLGVHEITTDHPDLLGPGR